MEIQAEVMRDPGLAVLPSIYIDTIQTDVPMDDRLNADDAFDRPFVDSLMDGMRWYLRLRGLRVVDAGGDLRATGRIVSYEGNKGWGDWGVEIALELKFFHEHELVLQKQLRSHLAYSNDHEVEDAEEARYTAHKMRASFPEILFTRVGIDLSEKLLTLMKERRLDLENATGTVQGSLANSGIESAPRGVITIEATVPHAEILIDGAFVGTAPLEKLAIPAGDHTLEVRKQGYEPWMRSIRVLAGAASRFVAELRRVEEH